MRPSISRVVEGRGKCRRGKTGRKKEDLQPVHPGIPASLFYVDLEVKLKFSGGGGSDDKRKKKEGV